MYFAQVIIYLLVGNQEKERSKLRLHPNAKSSKKVSPVN